MTARRRTLLTLVVVVCGPLSASAQRALHAVRDLTIDATANNLSVVHGVFASASGVIAVVQPQDLQVRFFDPAGHPVASVGRDGAGPGEFRSLGWVGWVDDTLHVEDSGLRRLTFIRADGKLLRSAVEPLALLPPRSLGDGAPFPGGSAVVGVAAGGSWLLDFFPGGALPAWLTAPQEDVAYSLIEVDPEAHFIRLTANLRSREPWCTWGTPAVTIPYCSHWVVGDGFSHAIAIVATGRPPSSDARFHLRVILSASGDTVIDRDYSYQPVPIPRRVVDSVRARLVSQPRLSPQKKASYEGVPFPKSYPPVLRVLVGMDRAIWLEEPSPVRSIHHWRVLDARGGEVGTVDLPAEVELADVRHGTAWGTAADADGLQSVVRYRIE